MPGPDRHASATPLSARDEILGRIRDGLRTARPSAEPLPPLTAGWPESGSALRPPAGDEPGLTQRFVERAIALASTVCRVPDIDAVPAAVADYLRANGLPASGVAWPEFAPLDWRAAGLDVEFRVAGDADGVGITGAFLGLAETGTLMLLSGPETAATTSLLPETHIAILRAGRIVHTMEDAFAGLREAHGQLPRAVNFISGPSRTGDIEQTIVLGAHGPARVHIVVVGHA